MKSFRPLRLVPELVPALFLLASLPPAVRAAARNLVVAARHWSEPPATARRRVMPADYVEAIEHLRRTLPLDEPLCLADGGDWHGHVFIRYDLAPRRFLYLFGLDAGGKLTVPLPPDAPRYTVINHGILVPPSLVTTRSLVREGR